MSGRKNKPEPSGNTKQVAWWKFVVSGLLLLHLAAVFTAPFYMSTRTPVGASSPVAARARSTLEPYINAMFLDHGYAFFAPDPGPSHLIRYRVEFDDGRLPIEGVFPDLDRHWPRLLYHRHFMLSEQLHSDYVSPFPPEKPEREMGESDDDWKRRLADWEEQTATWKVLRARYETKWKSFENHLLKRYGGDRVSLVRVEHRLPPPDASRGPIDLRDERRYFDLSEYPEAEELSLPVAPSPDVQIPLRPPLAPQQPPPLEELP